MTKRYKRLLRAGQLILAAGLIAQAVPAPANAATSLTLADVRQRALQFNRTYLAAQEDVKKSEAQVVQARSGALPDLTLNGGYSRNFKLPSFFVQPDSGQPIEFRTGFKNDFSAALTARQSIWQGGKVFKALHIAKLYREYSNEKEAQVKANVIVTAEQLFFAAILQQSTLATLNKAYEANSYNLDVVQKYYDKGMVSQYELLRARVEKDNLKPQIFQAESNLKLAQKQLKSYIGMELGDSVTLIEAEDDTSLAGLPSLPALIDTALANRPEMLQAKYLTRITKEAVGVAKGDYYPSLSAVSTFSWTGQSDEFTLQKNNTRSWSAGLNLSVPLFKGGKTTGAVRQAQADYQQASLAARDVQDAVRLEVEGAYDQLMQAKKSLDIQGVTIAEAEEGLKIANLRYESGVGTLLEVLSAQTALTQARNSLAQAKYSFRDAKAQLRKATTIEIQ
jgi:outer membrane protein TolC